MSLPSILDAIRLAGEAEVRQIQERAAVQARQIMAENLERIRQAREAACLEASAEAARARARLIHHARLEALQIMGETREALIDETIEQARGALRACRANPEYPQILSRLIREALVELSQKPIPPHFRATDERAFFVKAFDEKIHLEVDPRDRPLASAILDELGVSATITVQLTCWGGVIARSKDDRITVTNTLEARLERAVPYLRRALAAYFEQVIEPSDEGDTQEGQDVRI